ncbi:MAG: gliding motility-associated C-terminal domain-containing protein [Bacteroidetes bacterium]|nr:gliding motility-associated C-terminal domain-containing protein [Bacteroidota bacterium]
MAVSTGTCSDTTKNALLSVSSVTSLTDPANLTMCAGTDGEFTIVPTGVTTIEWQYSSDNGQNFQAVPNAAPYSNVTSSILRITGATSNMDGYLYRCFVVGCLLNATSKSAKITMLHSPSITTDPTDAKVCSGTATSFAVASPDATNYEWELSTNSGVSFTKLSNTNSTLNITDPNTMMNNFQYRAIAKGSCAPTTSAIASLTVDTTTVSITVNKPVVCTGDSSVLVAIGNPINATYLWNTGEVNSKIGVNNNSIYTVVAKANGCLSGPASASIKVVAKPEVDAGEDALVCPGATIQLGGPTKEGHSYSWSSDPKGTFDSSINPKVIITENVIFVVRATIAECPDVASDTVIYTMIEGSSLFVPNAFTPNGDGVNDIFKVESIGLIEFSAIIFNRWGEEIYQWNNAADGWNGMVRNASDFSQEDVYVYKITSKNLCDIEAKQRTGTVTIIK